MENLSGSVAYPLKLSFKSKAWYLQSFCVTDNDYRIFKFTRISNMKVSDTSFDRNNYEVPKLKTAEEPPAPSSIEVRLSISPHAKFRIYDEFAENDITSNDDGSLTVIMSEGQWIYDYILSYGTTVEVLHPQYMRDEMLLRARKDKK